MVVERRARQFLQARDEIDFGDTLRRLLLFRGTRMALKRKGFQKDVKLIANSTSEQCIAALKSSAGQPGEVRNANMEALSNNEKIALELRTALRQVLISTKDVPLTDGYKRNLRHESHNLNIAEGALVVFATFNFADNYAPLLFQLVRGGSDGSVEHIGEDIVCRLTDDAPNMPSLQQMHQLRAQAPRAQGVRRPGPARGPERCGRLGATPGDAPVASTPPRRREPGR